MQTPLSGPSAGLPVRRRLPALLCLVAALVVGAASAAVAGSGSGSTETFGYPAHAHPDGNK
ncbi:hypothetical protein GCM10020369_72820 [Cryptosporangium minutisporangium]|uniref:Uncharacterized protein n=1 Tax=Cryptosporangium minutisporangium TaxID=113569 RepID=A0ABP6TAX5_9ACTN